MRTTIGPALTLLSLVATIFGQGRPDLSGKWTETGAAAGQVATVMTVLPSGYVGGQLTTNTVVSRQAIGEASDPPGYVQPSIATVRLWRRRS